MGLGGSGSTAAGGFWVRRVLLDLLDSAKSIRRLASSSEKSRTVDYGKRGDRPRQRSHRPIGWLMFVDSTSSVWSATVSDPVTVVTGD